MQELLNKLKTMKNATQTQFDEMVAQYAYKEVLKNLKDAGLEKDDITQEEFDDLLSEQKERTSAFAKGALGASGVFLFLELLG